MTTIAAPTADLPGRPRAAASHAIEVAAGLGEAEAAWREIEEEGALMSPYGRYDWVAPFVARLCEPSSCRVAVVRDGTGRPALVVPVSIERRAGLRLGVAIGGKHVNFNLPPCRADVAAQLTPEGTRSLLREVGRALGIDAFVWPNAPAAWAGRPNPFAAGGRPSPSDAWSLSLERDGEATLKRSMSPEARKKLRNKSRGLAKLGPVGLLEGRGPDEVGRILDAFFRQKEARFGELGIDDPFADPRMGDFIRAAALPETGRAAPAIELYGLAVGDRILAVLGGAADADRLSGMFVSFDQGEGSKFSPGEILVTQVIERQCARGRSVFDLGVGDARYKRSICDRVEALVDVAVPVTRRGGLYVAARGAAIDAKRRIKASPRAMALVGRARRLKALLRP